MVFQVGEKYERIDGPVTRQGIKEYADASGDRNPIHVDEDFATNRGGLNGVIAHGMLFFGYALHLLSDLAEKNGGKFVGVDCQMRGSVRPGDWVQTKVEVKSIENNIVTLDVNQVSLMPLKVEKDGKVVKSYEGEDRKWVKDKEASGIKSEDLFSKASCSFGDVMVPAGKLIYREWVSILASAKIELPPENPQ